MTLPLIDDFNRADEDPLQGYTKVSGSGQLGIVGNQVVRTQTLAAYVLKDGLYFHRNQQASIVLSTIGGSGTISSILLRATGNTFYRVGVAPSPSQLVIERWIAGAPEAISGSPFPLSQTLSNNDVLRAKIVDNSIEAFLNDQLLITVFDPGIQDGSQAGFQVSGSPWAIDDFRGASVVEPTGFKITGKILISVHPIYER